MAGIGLNGALWLGYSGLQVAQQEINTAGRNLANSSTPGASRQRVAVSEDTTVQIGGQNLSIGVYALGITGTRSPYLDSLVQTENSNLGSATATDNLLTLVQNALQEALSSTQTDGTQTASQTGLEAASTNLFNAWSKLAADPTDSSLRDAVSSAAVSFSTTAKAIYGQMLDTKQSAFTEAGTETKTANSLITQIADLNQQIASAEVGSQAVNGIPINQANDMRDQREALVEQLSSIVNIKVTPDAKNASMIDIQLADATSGTNQLATATPPALPATGTLTLNGTTVNIASGDDLSTIAANINASVPNVTATVSNGNLVLNSLSSITTAGTSSLATALSLAQGPNTSAPITLVQGSNGGGVTYSGAADPGTYSLTVAGSSQGVSGYGADKSLFILAQNGTTGTISAGPTGGSLGGLVTFDNQTLGYQDENSATFTTGRSILDRFNTYLNNVVTTVNNLVSTGYDLNGNAATGNPPNELSTASAPTLPATGTLVINGTTYNIAAGDDLNDIAAKINASGSNVTAAVTNGNLSINSASALSVSGTSTLSAALTGGVPSTHGGDFFYDSATGAASTGAWDLGVNQVYDYTNTDYNSNYIPAATTQVSSGQSNDGSLADQIGNQVSNSNIYPFYTTLVSDVGAMSQAATTNLSAQQLVSTQANTSQQSYSGISTDEEMTNLVSYQRAFEANSRFINTINQMYQLLTQNLGN